MAFEVPSSPGRRDASAPCAGVGSRDWAPSPDELGELLDCILEERRIDLSGYKKSCLLRRLSLRMREAKASSLEEYRAKLLRDTQELDRLLDRVFVTYSEFFRDAKLFDYVEKELLPAALERETCRIWCAGCARGEEAYSLAMLIAEQKRRRRASPDVRIYATDIHEPAIEHARAGVYSEMELKNVPADLRATYFQPVTGGGKIQHDLRRAIVFACHDLAQDAPIGKIDILFCRNTNIYFDRDLQRKVLSSLLYALRPNGILVLGRAELPQRWGRHALEPVEGGLKVFRKRSSKGGP